MNTSRPLAPLLLTLAVGVLTLTSRAGTFSFINLTADEETGIDPSKTYTHLVDFGSDAAAATINGVRFTSKALTGPTYTLSGPGGDFVNNGQGAFEGSGLGDLFTDFYYGGAAGGVQTLTLLGLKEAHTYRLSFFVSGWGTPAVDISASDAPGVTNRLARDGTSWGPDGDNQSSTDAGHPGAAIQYEFVAGPDGTLVMTLDAISQGDTFHHYGFVNELVGLPDDSDGDGIPNIYEQANGLNPSVNDAALDLDSDGLNNLDEYKIGTAANQADTDNDGLKDGTETRTGTWVSDANTGTDPLLADTDNDGLKDGVENNSGTFASPTQTGTHPLKPDSDTDGFDDGVEVTTGHIPTNAANSPESDVSIRTAVEFRFNAARGISYRIEGSSDLQNWTSVEAAVNGNGTTVTRFYSIENQPYRFFRARRN
ncbi:MAG: hypothetical protein JNK85_19270 [Verrucomicrobiales bacterium]|nr:hypothetical protein [Verrucomicrobiales bacterium]